MKTYLKQKCWTCTKCTNAFECDWVMEITEKEFPQPKSFQTLDKDGYVIDCENYEYDTLFDRYITRLKASLILNMSYRSFLRLYNIPHMKKTLDKQLEEKGFKIKPNNWHISVTD
jgi:hypothetical protein